MIKISAGINLTKINFIKLKIIIKNIKKSIIYNKFV